MSGVTFAQGAMFAQPSHKGQGPVARLVALLARNARLNAEQMTERYLHRRPVGGGVNWLGDGIGLD